MDGHDTELEALKQQVRAEPAPEEQPKRRGRPPKNAAKPAAETVEKKSPPKRSRYFAEKRERKARNADSLDASEMKLAVHPDILAEAEAEQQDLRWVNDDGYRIAHLQQKEWTIVPAEGFEGRRVVGTKENGDPLEAVLMSKPKEWHDEDRRKKQKKLDEQMSELKRGRNVDAGSADGTPIQATGAAYVPSSGIEIDTPGGS